MSRRVPEYADVYAPYLQCGSIGLIYAVASVVVALRWLSAMGLSGGRVSGVSGVSESVRLCVACVTQ